jgi:hypothetical protein
MKRARKVQVARVCIHLEKPLDQGDGDESA